jgi:MFS transporter, SP family, arabinose:H+ symporter
MKLTPTLLKATAVGALGGLLFGFDTAVIAGTTHSLTLRFGLTPRQLGLTVTMALIGTIIGAMSAGIPGQRWGARETLRMLAIFYVLSSFGCAFALNWPMLLVARFIGGLGIGGSSVLGPVYIAELAPARMRGRLVTNCARLLLLCISNGSRLPSRSLCGNTGCRFFWPLR